MKRTVCNLESNRRYRRLLNYRARKFRCIGRTAGSKLCSQLEEQRGSNSNPSYPPHVTSISTCLRLHGAPLTPTGEIPSGDVQSRSWFTWCNPASRPTGGSCPPSVGYTPSRAVLLSHARLGIPRLRHRSGPSAHPDSGRRAI